jgi:hypothetical protein
MAGHKPHDNKAVDSHGNQPPNPSEEEIQWWLDNGPGLWQQVEACSRYHGDLDTRVRDLEDLRDRQAQDIRELERTLSKNDATLASLQETMLQGRDRFQPVDDKRMKQQVEILSTNIKPLAMKIKQQLSLTDAELKRCLCPKPGLLGDVVFEAAWKDVTVWKHLLSSFLWARVYAALFAHPFQVYSSDGKDVRNSLRCYFQVCHGAPYCIMYQHALIRKQVRSPTPVKGGDHSPRSNGPCIL